MKRSSAFRSQPHSRVSAALCCRRSAARGCERWRCSRTAGARAADLPLRQRQRGAPRADSPAAAAAFSPTFAPRLCRPRSPHDLGVPALIRCRSSELQRSSFARRAAPRPRHAPEHPDERGDRDRPGREECDRHADHPQAPHQRARALRKRAANRGEDAALVRDDVALAVDLMLMSAGAVSSLITPRRSSRCTLTSLTFPS